MRFSAMGFEARGLGKTTFELLGAINVERRLLAVVDQVMPP